MSITIHIELESRRLILKNSGTTINTFPVAIGKPATPTPTGDYAIISKLMNPGGVLGTRWMKFTHREHGVHGTNQPWAIGQAVSLGCVRMYNKDAETVYSKVSVGTPVIIRQSFSDSPSNPNDGSTPTDGSYFIYTVQTGDSLWKIGRKYNVTVAEIKRINQLKDDRIYPNQKLKIPRK